MDKIIVTYETFHGSEKKIIKVISKVLDCKRVNVNTSFGTKNKRN